MNRKNIITSLLVLAVILCSTMSFSCGKDKQITPEKPDENESGTEKAAIRIVSYNLLFEKQTPTEENRKWSNRLKVVKKMFQDYSFDIVGTQEILTWQVNDLTASGDYGRIGKDLWGQDETNNENAAIFYRKSTMEVLRSGDFWFSLTPEKAGSYSWEATYPRKCTWGEFKDKKTGKTFFVFNSHLHADATFSQSRLESAKLLLKKSKEIAKNQPVIFTGDFNSDPASAPVQAILNDKTMQDAYQIAKKRTGPVGTFHGFNTQATPTARIDYVFVNDKIAVAQYLVPDSELRTGNFGSDHLPVITDVQIN